MSVKRSFIIGIITDESIPEVNDVLSRYVTTAKDTSSHMYFAKQPIDPTNISNDVIFFYMEAENDSLLDEKLKKMINDLEELDVEYVLRDERTGEFLVTVSCGGQIAIGFERVKFLKEGTFEKIDALKYLNTNFGYCKGFKPSFRPLEGRSIEDLDVLPEVIYIASDCEENLLKLRDYIYRKVLEIDDNLECEFTLFFR